MKTTCDTQGQLSYDHYTPLHTESVIQHTEEEFDEGVNKHLSGVNQVRGGTECHQMKRLTVKEHSEALLISKEYKYETRVTSEVLSLKPLSDLDEGAPSRPQQSPAKRLHIEIPSRNSQNFLDQPRTSRNVMRHNDSHSIYMTTPTLPKSKNLLQQQEERGQSSGSKSVNKSYEIKGQQSTMSVSPSKNTLRPQQQSKSKKVKGAEKSFGMQKRNSIRQTVNAAIEISLFEPNDTKMNSYYATTNGSKTIKGNIMKQAFKQQSTTQKSTSDLLKSISQQTKRVPTSKEGKISNTVTPNMKNKKTGERQSKISQTIKKGSSKMLLVQSTMHTEPSTDNLFELAPKGTFKTQQVITSLTPNNKPFQNSQSTTQFISPAKNIKLPHPNTKKSLTDLSSLPYSSPKPFSDDDDDIKSAEFVPLINLNFTEPFVVKSSPCKRMPPKGETSTRTFQSGGAMPKGEKTGRRLLQLHKSDDFTTTVKKMQTPKNKPKTNRNQSNQSGQGTTRRFNHQDSGDLDTFNEVINHHSKNTKSTFKKKTGNGDQTRRNGINNSNKKLQEKLNKVEVKAEKRKRKIMELNQENLQLRQMLNFLLQTKLNE